MAVELLLGNEAIGLGIVEQGCQVVTAYPGTPSSEILAHVITLKGRDERQLYAEWSTNEKVAFEVALAASWSGLRSAVAMKQVGLNVAADPLFSAAYTGTVGGMLVVVADDPGPHSSQTEQDSRLMALNAKIPVFDPASPAEARAMVGAALALSERYGIPVMLRPTTRVCHTLQTMLVGGETLHPAATGRFRKNSRRWAATPKLRHGLHRELAEKMRQIAVELADSPFNYVVDGGSSERVGVIASGVAFHTVCAALETLGVRLPVLKTGTPHPLPLPLIEAFTAGLERVVVVEEPDATIELQIPDRRRVRGRLDGTVPAAGELIPERVGAILAEILAEAGYEVAAAQADAELQRLVDDLELPPRRPRLCPGCGHRSSFYAVKREFGPRAIYPGDIGCYTLGLNLRAVDTVLDMGASISMAHGFYQAGRLLGDKRPIVAAIGDSTFLHSGVAPLIDAVHNGARFVLLILDNRTTAMTGFQPTAAGGLLADGSEAPGRVSFVDLASACGVTFVREADPYDRAAFREVLRAAQAHAEDDSGGVAVVVASRPCVLYDPTPVRLAPQPVMITDECDGCRYCLEAFECPALVLRADGSRVDVDEGICIDCGQCVDACYKGFIQWKEALVGVA